MIEFLSNQEWIKPQIDFLLFLQNIRIAHSEIFDRIFLSVTVLGEYWLPTLICAIVYWCIDCKTGIYLFSLNSFNIIIAHLFKMIACVYRPWVLDSRIHPSELAVPYAKGYSFPSGHSAMSASVMGGIAYILRNKKLAAFLLIFLVLLVGFSRMWLGVHTPQDVVCGILIGFFLIFGINGLINWAEKDKNRYLYLLIGIDIFVIFALLFVFCFNTYRIDYVDGEILVDPQGLKYHTIVLFAYAVGLINGCFLCRRFCPFEPKAVSLKRRILRGIVGTVIVVLMLKFIFEYVVMNIINYPIAVFLMLLTGLTVTLIYPAIFSMNILSRKLKE